MVTPNNQLSLFTQRPPLNTQVNQPIPRPYKQQFLFLYDGTFNGLLTTIFEIYERKAEPLRIEAAHKNQPFLFGQCLSVETNLDKAQRVMLGVEKKTSEGALHSLYKAFLAEQPGIEMIIYRWVKYAMSSSLNIETNYTNDDVLRIKQINKQISREVHRMHAFVRFQRTSDNIYFATISPDFDVLPLLADHFERRYPDQQWVIYDTKRKKGIYFNMIETLDVELETELVDMKSGAMDATITHEEELLFKLLWQNYFSATNIKERKNMKLHIRHVPKRYWKYLSEKQPETTLLGANNSHSLMSAEARYLNTNKAA